MPFGTNVPPETPGLSEAARIGIFASRAREKAKSRVCRLRHYCKRNQASTVAGDLHHANAFKHNGGPFGLAALGRPLYCSIMVIRRSAFALAPVLALAIAAALPGAAHAAGWTLQPGENAAGLAFGTPVTDRDAFRLDCSGGMMSISTWAGSPPRGVSEGSFPTRLSVFFGNRELVFAATGRVTGPGGASRVDARIVDPAAFLTSLDQVNRLTTVIYAGRRMAATPTAEQTAGFRKACGF
jgi:hypothetical protein